MTEIQNVLLSVWNKKLNNLDARIKLKISVKRVCKGQTELNSNFLKQIYQTVHNDSLSFKAQFSRSKYLGTKTAC